MVEDAEKSFLNEIIKEEDEENVEKPNRDEMKKDVAEAVDKIIEEARIETSKRPQIKSEQINNSECKILTAEKDMSKPFINEPLIGTVRSEKQTSRSGPPPSVPPPPPPISTTESIEDDNKFEVNFDDAFGETTHELPKQLGGRASIPEPDELSPHQLERLKNLKESNA
ncbi:radixin-like [Contarinia nasturtii]|uniref:radixin-like n=1 Tax=Contarinia nasturtii TaxID=265458 RepID=UPI0012D39642|nr:radixin-like [Contarinia nasturtii]